MDSLDKYLLQLNIAVITLHPAEFVGDMQKIKPSIEIEFSKPLSESAREIIGRLANTPGCDLGCKNGMTLLLTDGWDSATEYRFWLKRYHDEEALAKAIAETLESGCKGLVVELSGV